MGAFICGGYARYCLSPNEQKSLKEASDIDVYCPTKEIFDSVYKWADKMPWKMTDESDMSVTYRPKKFKEIKIQLIKPMVEGAIVTKGDVITILDNFDFTVVRACLTSEKTGVVDEDFEQDERLHILRIKNIHCPISSVLRLAKYHKKGYYIPTFEVLKLFLDWDNRDQTYRDKIVDFFNKLHDDGDLSDEEIHELEKLMRID